MAIMITDPHAMDAEFKKVEDLLNRMEPFDRIPKNLFSDLNALLISWGDEYDSQDWGSSARTLASSAKWSNTDQQRWNSNLSLAKDLAEQISKTPGVMIAGQAIIAAPKPGPVIKGEDIEVRAQIPWNWIVGSASVLALVVAMFSKTKRPPAPAPAMGSFSSNWRETVYRHYPGVTPGKLQRELVKTVMKDPHLRTQYQELMTKAARKLAKKQAN
jgi:hypothetical protein